MIEQKIRLNPYMNILKFDHLSPVIATRELLHEMAVKYAEDYFDRHGHGPFIWLLGCGTHVTWVETEWRNDEEKAMAVAAIRRMAHRTDAQCYSFVSEAWVASRKLSDVRVPPSQRPKADRDDVMFILSVDRDKGYSSTRYLVTERRNGPNILGPRVDEDLGMASGQLFSIFDYEEAT